MEDNIQNIEVSITDLFLNNSNPRFNPVEDQVEAFEAMILDQKDKLVSLAEHIVENGLNPLEKILVSEINGKYVVQEGNRRVAVLKFLNNPNLITADKKIRDKFIVLSSKVDISIFKKIPCVLSNDSQYNNKWVSLKHTGENGGAGIVKWDAQQTERFKSLINTKRQFFLEELICRDDIPSDIRDKLSQVKKTNFDRIVQDPDMRKFLGISYSEGKYSLDEEFITPQLKLVLQDLVDDMSVGKIYQKRDRQEYIRELRERLENTDYVNYQDTDNEHNNKKQSFYEKINKEGDNFNNNFTKRRQGYFQNRKCLIPSNTNIPIQNPRIKKIYKELKELELSLFPNAIAVLFRVFVELSIDNYLKEKRISIKQDAKLSQKVSAVKDYFISNNIMHKNELHSVEMMISQPTESKSIRTFHQFVHNSQVTPSVDDLKNSWDDLSSFVRALWENI